MTQDAKNVMCDIFEKYCISKKREQVIDLSSFHYEKAAAIIKEIQQGGYISGSEKLGQAHYRLYIEDALTEFYE